MRLVNLHRINSIFYASEVTRVCAVIAMCKCVVILVQTVRNMKVLTSTHFTGHEIQFAE